MFSIGQNVTVTKTGSPQKGHVGVVCYATTRTVYVFDFMSESPKSWAAGDVKAGGVKPAPAPPDPVPPVPVPPSPPAPTSRLVVALDVPGDWPERVDPAMSKIAPAMVRVDIARVLADAAKAPKVMGFIRARNARVIALAQDGMAASTVVAFANRWLREGDVIEGENETNYVDASQQLAVGKAYGTRMKALRLALDAAGVAIPLIVQGDPAIRGTGFIDGLYASWPDVHAHPRVAGFSVHPYGPALATERMDGYHVRLAEQHKQLVAHGAPATVPIWITEYGISTHDGLPLASNYGWPVAMTFEQAGAALEGAVRDIASLPYNIVALSIFQAIDQGLIGDTRNGRELWFGSLDRNGNVKGAFTPHVVTLAAAFRG